MAVERVYDLRLASGRVVDWVGVSPEDAARRYVATYPAEVVVAVRDSERHGLHIGLQPILEPGDLGW